MTDKLFLRSSIILFIVFAILFTVAAAHYFNIQTSDEVIEQEKKRLYELEESIENNAATLISIDGVSVDVISNQVHVSFYGESCRLEAVYDNEMNCIEKNFIDTREKATPEIIITLILAGTISSAFVSAVSAEIICSFALRKQSRRDCKKANDNIS